MSRKTHRRGRGRKSGGAPVVPGNKSTGGSRKTRKSRTGANTWIQSVMRVYKEMKAKTPGTRFGDALKEASKRKKAGNL